MVNCSRRVGLFSFGHGHMTAYIGDVIHWVSRNWTFLPVQDPFVTVAASGRASACRQQYEDGIAVRKTLVLLNRVAQSRHIPCSSVCVPWRVWRDSSGIPERIGRVVCSANFVV